MAKRKTGQSRSAAKKSGAKTGGKRAGSTKKKTSVAAKRRASAAKTKKASPAAKKKKTSVAAKQRASAAKTKKASPAAKKKTAARRTTTKRTSPAGSGTKPASPKSPKHPAPAALTPPPSGITIAGIEIVARSKPLPKTKLRAKQLREHKELLLAKRRELLGDVSQLSNEALHTSRQESRGDLSNMPSHMADVGSDNWEQEFTLGLIATERLLLRQIDAALERIRNRTYGVCLATHCMISPERLEAKPWAQYCIEFARLRDTGRIPPGLV